MQAKQLSEFRGEIKLENSNETYDIFAVYKDCQFLMKISRNMEPNYWETTFELSKLQLENKILEYFENDHEFYDFIVKNIEENSAILSKTSDNDMKISFKLLKKDFSIVLILKKADVSESVNDIIRAFKECKEDIAEIKLDSKKNNEQIDKRFQMLEENFRKYNEKIEQKKIM